MNKRVKRIGALVIFGMFVLIMCAPTPSAYTYGGGNYNPYSWNIIIDYDNDADNEAFIIWHDRYEKDNRPGEELFRIQEDGKVGIGEPNPTNKLDINGSVRVRDLPQDDTLNNLVVADADGVLHVRDVSTIAGVTPSTWYGVATGAPPSDINDDIYTNGDVGIGTDTPVTTLDVNGGFATNIATVSNDYAPTCSDYTILVDASSGHVTIELPAAGDVPGQILVLKRIDDSKTNKVIIDADGSETIDGNLRIRLKVKFMSYTLQSDGSDWYIIASYGFMGRSHLNNKNR